MNWSGINHQIQGYGGTPLNHPDFNKTLQSFAWQHQDAWRLDYLPGLDGSLAIPYLTTESFRHLHASKDQNHEALYLSGGMHGDEPASPLAVLKLLTEGYLKSDFPWLVFPLLNPIGALINSRGNSSGIDLNRQYHPDLKSREPEVTAHLEFLQSCPNFLLSIMLHEDWESDGFYLYQLHKNNPELHGRNVIDDLNLMSPMPAPIDSHSEIDEREALDGVIDVNLLDYIDRDEWPEAFYLAQFLTDINYTLESPSDLDLHSRVKILTRAVHSLTHHYRIE